MKYTWADVIAVLYPGAEFSTHMEPDNDTLTRITVNEIATFTINNNFVVEWLDKTIPMPTAEEIIARVAEAEKLIDAAQAETAE